MQSNSFVQTSKHVSKSNKFEVVTPSEIAAVMQRFNFLPVHVKEGKAKHQDKADFQTTICRYRSNEDTSIDGLHFDVIVKVPHLYGAIEVRMGLFRGQCANQWNAGKLFERFKVSHLSGATSELVDAIPTLLMQRANLIALVNEFQGRTLTEREAISLAISAARIRLGDAAVNVIDIEATAHKLLNTVHRREDMGVDLWSVMNVLQENVTRANKIPYLLKSSRVDKSTGLSRDAVQRRFIRNVNEASETAFNLNSELWDSATKLLHSA